MIKRTTTIQVHWHDVANKIFDETFTREIRFFGLLIFRLNYVSQHTIPDDGGENKIGFNQGK